MFGTQLNSSSSRSHLIITLKLLRKCGGRMTSLNTRTSQLSIVDLAGSERAKKSGTQGEQIREAGKINNSLMAL